MANDEVADASLEEDNDTGNGTTTYTAGLQELQGDEMGGEDKSAQPGLSELAGPFSSGLQGIPPSERNDVVREGQTHTLSREGAATTTLQMSPSRPTFSEEREAAPGGGLHMQSDPGAGSA